MADIAITALSASGALVSTDLVPVVDDPGGTPVTKKATFAQVRTVIMPVALGGADVSGTLPVVNGGTGITALGSGVATFMATPSGANLASALTTALPVSKGGTGLTAVGTALYLLRVNAGATGFEFVANSAGAPSSGASTQVQTADGAGGFSAPANVFAGAGYISLGATPATAGIIRIPYVATDTIIGGIDSGGADRAIISRSAANVIQFGNANQATDVYGTTLRLYGTSTLVITLTSASVAVNVPKVEYKGNARHQPIVEQGNYPTTDATVTNGYTFTPTDECTTLFDVVIQAIQSGSSNTASFVRRVHIKRDGGTVTLGTVDTPWTYTDAAFSALVATIDLSGTTVRVRLTGIAATNIQWGMTTTRYETTYS